MELLCPHCMKKVMVSDDKAGQVLNCPLCQGVFAAPSLPSAPMRASAPPPPPPLMEIPDRPYTATMSGPPPVVTPPVLTQPVVTPPPPPRPPVPPADYSRRYTFRLRPDVLICIPPVCLFLLIICSVLPWHASLVIDGPIDTPSLWGLAFTERHGTALFVAYMLFTIFLAFPVSIACVVLEFGFAPTPPQLVQLVPWKSGITFALLLLTFGLFAYDYQQSVFATAVGGPIVFGEKLAFRLHFIALAASGLEVWVQSRRVRNLPLPRFSVKL